MRTWKWARRKRSSTEVPVRVHLDVEDANDAHLLDPWLVDEEVRFDSVF